MYTEPLARTLVSWCQSNG